MDVPEIIVVDASVSVKWINRREPHADKANLIWQDYEKGSVSFLFPQFWEYEIVNCVNKAVARGDLSPAEGQEAVDLLFAVPAAKLAMPSAQQSYQLARQYQRSVYDSFYLAAAEQLSSGRGILRARAGWPDTAALHPGAA